MWEGGAAVSESIDEELADLLKAWVTARRKQVEGRKSLEERWLEITNNINRTRFAEEAVVKWVDENLLNESES
jgi:hypothetical protein